MANTTSNTLGNEKTTTTTKEKSLTRGVDDDAHVVGVLSPRRLHRREVESAGELYDGGHETHERVAAFVAVGAVRFAQLHHENRPTGRDDQRLSGQAEDVGVASVAQQRGLRVGGAAVAFVCDAQARVVFASCA